MMTKMILALFCMCSFVHINAREQQYNMKNWYSAQGWISTIAVRGPGLGLWYLRGGFNPLIPAISCQKLLPGAIFLEGGAQCK